MGSITTAQLRVEGIEGIYSVLSFSFRQFPGEHARAELIAEAKAGRVKERDLSRRWIRVLAEGETKPLFCGRVQSLEEKMDGGYTQVTLRLVSGSILLDQKKENHSYQDCAMSYGALLTQVAEEGGGMVLYPRSLDHEAIGFPRIQYGETDWEFLARMASHFGLSLYPHPEGEGAGVWVGVPQGKKAEGFSWREYTLIRDERYEQLGGKQAGYTPDRFIGYEAESEENYRCGQVVSFRGRELTICAKSCTSVQAEVLFTYRLAYPEWAGQRKLLNEQLTGLSLLGRVLSRQSERLKLKLDIDEEHEDQGEETAYAFSWRPPTGNLLYLMPEEGSRVSLYFPAGEEEGAIAVNCIRREGEAEGADYRERGLRAEGKELKLYPQVMGLESEGARLLLEDTGGISISGRKNLQIVGGGRIRLEGKAITLEGGTGGVRLYHGRVERREGKEVIAPSAHLYVFSYQGKETLVSLSRDTHLLGCRYEDYSGDSYRFKDDPLEENYDWGALGIRVLGGLVIVGTVVIGAGIFTAGVAGINTAMVMGATAFCGSVAVGATAINDRIHGQVSSMSEYVRVALNGSIIGAMSGAAACIPTKGLGIMGKYAAEFCIGAGESAFEQQLWEGEIDFKEAVGYGILNVVLTGVLDNLAGQGKKVVEGGLETELFLPDEFYNKNLPNQVAPGTKYLPKYDELGNVKQIKMYDDYGREIGWVDYTNHGYGDINSPHYHTIPHWHEKIYNAQYPDGIKINHRTDVNTPLGDK